MGRVIKFPLHKFFHQVFMEIRKKQNDIKRKKTDFLYQEAYRFFLDQYLMKIAQQGAVDFPPFLYEAGIIICREAQTNAEKAIVNIVKEDKVDYCYSKRIKEIKKMKAV